MRSAMIYGSKFYKISKKRGNKNKTYRNKIAKTDILYS